MTTLAFFVPGLPVSQGSIRSLGAGRPSVHGNAVKLLPWRDSVTIAAHNAAKISDWDRPVGAVEVTLWFRLQAPKSRPRELPHVRPDIDKLVRACLDALTAAGNVIHDDSQVTDLIARKRYADDTQPLGCDIEVTAL